MDDDWCEGQQQQEQDEQQQQITEGEKNGNRNFCVGQIGQRKINVSAEFGTCFDAPDSSAA
jgi:hypothetical protein